MYQYKKMIQENRMELAPTIGTESAEELPQEAEEYAEYQRANPDAVFPVCMGCHFNAMRNAIIEEGETHEHTH